MATLLSQKNAVRENVFVIVIAVIYSDAIVQVQTMQTL